MAVRIDTPPTLAGDEKKQLEQLWSYLYQLSENINSNLEGIGSNELTDSERKTMKAIIGEGEKQGLSEMESLKSLIIKTADFVQTSMQEYRLNLLGSTVDSGQFGRYVRNTGLNVVVNPEGITQNYSFEEVVQGLKEFSVNAKNYIKTGLLRTVNSIPVYGVAIGKDVVTFSRDGTETYNDGNKVAELTADELSFWQNSVKIASYTGSKITFYYGGSAVFYIENGKIYCNEDITLATGKKLIIDSTNFKMDSDGKLTIIGGGLNNASGVLTIKDASGNTIGTWDKDGIVVNEGSILADVIKGGTLLLGGLNNASGVLTIKDASGNTIGTWDKDGFSSSTASFGIASENLEIDSSNGYVCVKKKKTGGLDYQWEYAFEFGKHIKDINQYFVIYDYVAAFYKLDATANRSAGMGLYIADGTNKWGSYQDPALTGTFVFATSECTTLQQRGSGGNQYSQNVMPGILPSTDEMSLGCDSYKWAVAKIKRIACNFIEALGWIDVSSGTDARVAVSVLNGLTRCILEYAQNMEHGLRSEGYHNGSTFVSDNKWMIYRDSSGDIIVNGKCTGSAGAVESSAFTTRVYTKNLTVSFGGTASGTIDISVPSGYAAISVAGFNVDISDTFASKILLTDNNTKISYSLRNITSGYGDENGDLKVTVLLVKTS